ncbi:MAG: hypothetical protein LBU82_03200 [Treponema sp.]|jgi:flagellar motor component MotA|nr:hypothetical protein [Treponema sp.]
MTHDEFIAEYFKVSARAIEFSEKARREGLLSLESFIDFEKVDKRDIFEYGLLFVIDGTDQQLVKDLLSIIIEQEEDKYTRKLMKIKLEAVLSIQSGVNTRIIAYKLNAFTNLALKDDPITKKFKEDRDNTGEFSEVELDALLGGRI